MYEGAHQLNKLCMMTTKLQIRKAYSQGSQLLTLRKSTKLKEHLRVGLAISFLETDPCDRLPNSEEAAIGFQQLNLYLKANYRGIKLVGGWILKPNFHSVYCIWHWSGLTAWWLKLLESYHGVIVVLDTQLLSPEMLSLTITKVSLILFSFWLIDWRNFKCVCIWSSSSS